MRKLTSIIVSLAFMLTLAACGGGSGQSGNENSNNQNQMTAASVNFIKPVAEFNKYEPIILKADECHSIAGISGYLRNFVTEKKLSDGSLIIDKVYEPGSHSIVVTLRDDLQCNREREFPDGDTFITLNFDVLPALTVIDPVQYLSEKINNVILLVNEMLLTEKDPQTISMLKEILSTLISELQKISTQDISITTKTATIMLNNDPLASLPSGAILDPDRAALIVGSSVLFVGGFATGNAPIMFMGLFGLIYNYSEFIKEFELASEKLYQNIRLTLSNLGDFNLGFFSEDVPAGVTVTPHYVMTFSTNLINNIKIKKTGSISPEDISIIEKIKVSIIRITTFLPSSMVKAITEMSTSERTFEIIDLTSYSITPLTDNRLLAKITNATDILNGANQIGIMVSKVDGAVFTETTVPFTLILSNGLGHQLQIPSQFYPNIPPPQAADQDFWFDFRIDKIVPGTVDTYTTSLKYRNILLTTSLSGTIEKTVWDILRMNTRYAETIEIVTPPKYLTPLNGGNYLNVWTGNGIENSVVYLSIDPASFSLHLPDGGEMTDFLQYRVHNAAGVSAIKTIRFGSKYNNSSTAPIDIDVSKDLASGKTFTIPLIGETGYFNPNYDISLTMIPSYYETYVQGDWISTKTGRYTLRFKVYNKATQKYVSIQAPEDSSLRLFTYPYEVSMSIYAKYNDVYEQLPVIYNGPGGAWDFYADMSNGAEVYIGDPSYVFVNEVDINVPLQIRDFEQLNYARCLHKYFFDYQSEICRNYYL